MILLNNEGTPFIINPLLYPGEVLQIDSTVYCSPGILIMLAEVIDKVKDPYKWALENYPKNGIEMCLDYAKIKIYSFINQLNYD